MKMRLPIGKAWPVSWLVLVTAAVAAIVVFALRSPFFLSANNLANMATDIAVAGIVAVPATFLMMAGSVDLSVGATAAFTGIVLASATPDLGIGPAVVLALVIALVVGSLNGFLTVVVGLDSVLVTFAMMALMRGLSYLIPSGLAIVVPGFRWLGNARLIPGLPVPVVIFLIAAVVGVAVSASGWGRRMRDHGERPVGERRRGGRCRLAVIAIFAGTGLAAALAGLIRTSELSTGVPTSATGLEIVVTAAVLLGGGRLAGGRGSVVGTILAILVISLVDNGLSLLNETPYATQVFHAALLVLALVVGRPVGFRLGSVRQR